MKCRFTFAATLAFSITGCAATADLTDDPTDETPADEPAAPALVAPTHVVVRRANAIPNQYVVVMQPSARRARVGIDADAVLARLADTYSATVGTRYTHAIDGFAATMSDADAQRLAEDPEVAFVEEDALVHADATTESNATWGLDRIDQGALPLDKSYTFLADGTGVTAYVIDTGIRATHHEFTGRILPGFTSINDGQGTNDCHFHGTHVSGTVAGTILGVAKKASIVPVRVLDCMGSGPASGVIAGLDFVAKNHRSPAVVNMSLGGAASDAEDAAVRTLIAAGVTVVTSAGNDNRDACLQSPARLPEAITVAASGMTDARASFSNFGTCVDVFAPGVDIFAASNSGDDLGRLLSGTSQASPHVAGVVALYLAEHPTATPAQVRDALVGHATPGKITDLVGSPNVLLNANFVDTTKPVAAITSPAPNARVAQSFAVTATASDRNLATVQLAVDRQLVGTVPATGPFTFQVANLAAGPHELTLTATDLAGGSSVATVSVTVEDPSMPPPGGGSGSGGGNGSDGGCSTTGGTSSVPLALALAALALRRRRAA